MMRFISGNKWHFVISVTALLLFWQIISARLGVGYLVPTPGVVAQNIKRILLDDSFPAVMLASLYRVMLGFLIAFLLAGVLGTLSGISKTFNHLMQPLAVTIKAMPTIAIILLALIWLGSEIAPILVCFLVIFPIMYENTTQGIQSVDPKLLEMADSYNMSRVAKIKDIYLPAISSYVLAGMSTAMGLNLKVAVTAEVLSQPRYGIGTELIIERAHINTAGVFAWAFIVIIIAFIFDLLIQLIQKRVERWKAV